MPEVGKTMQLIILILGKLVIHAGKIGSTLIQHTKNIFYEIKNINAKSKT